MSESVFLGSHEQLSLSDTEVEEQSFSVTWKIKISNLYVEMVYMVFLKWDGKARRARDGLTSQESAVKIFLNIGIHEVNNMFTYWVHGLTDSRKL